MNGHTVEYDFVVVGAGTSGCLLASRLAHAPSGPRVALIEAGADTITGHVPHHNRMGFDRFSQFMRTPQLDFGYNTAPLKGLNDRVLPYARGKGLGGSSQINFSAFTTGPSDDYDKWAELVQDDAFSWENVQRAYNEIVTVDDSMVKDSARRYTRPTPIWKESHGELQLSYASQGLPDYDLVLQAAETEGWKMNSDVNSGDPIGLGMVMNTSNKGLRMTSATAFLQDRPSNLTIITDATGHKILFDDASDRVTAVLLADGRKIRASKEILLSCGSIDTPKLLLLSGLGPTAELTKHNIPIKHNIPGIGQNLADHCFLQFSAVMGPLNDSIDRHFDDEAQELARKDWDKATEEMTTKWLDYNAEALIGFAKLDDKDLEKALVHLDDASQWREYVRRPRVPHFEIFKGGTFVDDPAWRPSKEKGEGTVHSYCIFPHNVQSRGSVTLADADPRTPPITDLALFEHPFDVAVGIVAYREAMKITHSKVLKQHFVRDMVAPKSDSDEDILEFMKATCIGTWHACGTVKMGTLDDKMACVDGDFKLRGVEGVRVVDCSVLPFMVNAHTQAAAFLVGQIAAEKVIKEYGL